jgi:glyoxylase-like metal-dependent hydrolase (beta-lactamase superfamily II)
MKEILPGIFTWHEFSEEKQLNFNGYLLITAGESVLIDPPRMTEEVFTKFESLAGKNSKHPLQAILLTNVHHERECGEVRKKLDAPVLINEKDEAGLEGKADKTFADGDALPCGLMTFKFENQKSPGESAFFQKERGVMILGDALIGKVPGKLNMLPPDKYRDSKLAKKGLSKLLDYEFESLLVGDGESILMNAKEAVKVFLES